jgi:hypothetical protein
MRTITTTLVREWFSEILAEDKRIAYREIKPWGRVKKRPRRDRNIPCCTRTGCGPFGDGCSGPESFVSPQVD